VPLARGDVDAICCFEPYVTFAELNGFGKKLWVPYDTPMGQNQSGVRGQHPLHQERAGADESAGAGACQGDEHDAREPQDRDRDHHQAVQHEPGSGRGPSTKNLFFSADSGEGFQSGLKSAGLALMLANKMLDSEPKWDEFINTSFI